MSDLADEPSENDITYADSREAQNQLQGLIREEGGDYQEAVDDQLEGEQPEDPPANESMP